MMGLILQKELKGLAADTSTQMRSRNVRHCVHCRPWPVSQHVLCPCRGMLNPDLCQYAPPSIFLTGTGPLQATLEERLNRSEETRKTFRHFLTEVARGSENTKNGRDIPAKVRSAREKRTGLPCFAG